MGRKIFTLLFSLCIAIAYCQTELGGIINQYAQVTAVDNCANIVIVDDASQFSVGQRIIIYQAQTSGANMNSSNNSNFGQMIDIGGAGLYEINSIKEINSNFITLDFAFANNNYQPSEGPVQILSFPSYENVVIKEALTALAWDGTKGGILALEVTENLTLEAGIDVSGKGFRGGVSPTQEEGNCRFFVQNNNYFYNSVNWRGSVKGEGIAQYIPGKEAGRGPQANGGGGGNDHNAGGGGGANLSVGGIGSEVLVTGTACRGRNPGLGGIGLESSSNRVFFGGGGGAGHKNNDLKSEGGNGGGIIFLFAKNISSNGNSITANGLSAEEVRGDGAGGGGAGGAILLNIQNITDQANIQVIGGNGGNQDSGGGNRCYGIGGGGGGGVIYKTNTINSLNSIQGGSQGLSLRCPLGELIAQPGENGKVFENYTIITSDQDYEPLNVTTTTPIDVCPTQPVTITPMIQGLITNYQWQVNQGQGYVNLNDNNEVSGTQSEALTINNPNASFIYRLIITGVCGETNTSDPIDLRTKGLPIARFNFIIDGQSVDIINTSRNGDSFTWDFGDGRSSNEDEPSHTYQMDGQYTIKMTATNDCGTTETEEIVEILPALSAGFIIEETNGCAPFEAQFFNTSSNGSTIVNWLFPGGSPINATEPNPVITYDAPGVYSASLIVTDGNEVDTLIQDSIIIVNTIPTTDFQFTVNESTVNFDNGSSNAVNYDWDFGDGNSSNDVNPTHTYNSDGIYQVTLTSINECGNTLQTKEVTIILSPTASFSFNQNGACAPSTIQFSDNSNGTITNRLWRFPGAIPTESNELNPVVTYTNPGTYTASLIVNNETQTDSFTIDNIVVIEPTQAEFQSTASDLDVSFTNNSINANQYEWDFGDGNQSSQQNPTHTYDSDGVFTVQLISSNECSNDTIVRDISLSETPSAFFSTDATSGCAPFTIRFTDQSTGTINNREWQFPGGNPTSSNSANPVVSYSSSGNYAATLIVGNELANDTITLETITIIEPTLADFQTSINELNVSFTNNSISADRYEWNFGDGTTSQAINPEHAFPTDGTFNIQLISFNECSSDTIVRNISLSETPSAFFSTDATSGCVPFTIQFTDQSTGTINNREWQFPGGNPTSSTLS